MTEKIKILTISDMPLSPSGVGTQTKYVIESLLKTGKFQVVSLGGAIKHPKYEPIKTEEWGDDWIMYPVDGFGTPDVVRSIMRNHRPDLLWFMIDPRFFGWLWEIEDEIRSQIPMVYYHVWDNFPAPHFNAKFYNSNDVICTISKVTDAIVRLLPGAINDESSALSDSFQDGLVAPPVYTRPEKYEDMIVPPILLSGNEKKIEEWRFEQSVERTKLRRPDLLKKE